MLEIREPKDIRILMVIVTGQGDNPTSVLSKKFGLFTNPTYANTSYVMTGPNFKNSADLPHPENLRRYGHTWMSFGVKNDGKP